MKKKIKFGVVGCGNVSPTYLHTLVNNSNSEVLWVADINSIKARQRIETFGIPRAYENYEEAIRIQKPDAVIICSPHYAHKNQAIASAKAGIDILCEKPLATNLEDTISMINECKTVRLGVMLQRRFYKNSEATSLAIKIGAIGKIQNSSLKFSCNKSPDFYESWRGKTISGGGVLLSQALHRIDQLVYFFGKPIEVAGRTRTTRDYIEVEDYAKGHILFENGVRTDIETNNSEDEAGNETISLIRINGEKGSIVLSDDKTPIWNVRNIPKPEEEDTNAIPQHIRPSYYGPCHEVVIDDFVDSILERRNPAISGKDSLDSMKIIFGFYESANNGGTPISLI
jgi:UDP-N-acetyl-2-amino-2-deoxyglucuronate dehydrogenase